MKVVVVAFAVSVLSGCAAAPTTGPVASADGTFKITRQSETQTSGSQSQNTAMATQEAEAHCLKMGKKFKAIQTKETITAGAPRTEVQYACN
jgi:hypothetical protein